MNREALALHRGWGTTALNEQASGVETTITDGLSRLGSGARALISRIAPAGSRATPPKKDVTEVEADEDRYREFMKTYAGWDIARGYDDYDPELELPPEVSADILRRMQEVAPIIFAQLDDHDARYPLSDRNLVVNEAFPASSRPKVPEFLVASYGHRLRAFLARQERDKMKPEKVITHMNALLLAMISEQPKKFEVPPLDVTNPVFGKVAAAYRAIANKQLV